jgi:succinylglutamate desuccinylase
MSDRFSIINGLPDDFFQVDISNIREVFPVPTLVQLEGDKPEVLFVSILLHGNEYSGLKSLQKLLTKYRDHLPRSLSFFVGNVNAAEANLRLIPGQTDFNRCWPGTELKANTTTAMMQKVVNAVTDKPLFAAIDLHNNNGVNPHYACMTDVTLENQHLAAMFNHIAVFFQRPKGVSTMAFNGICPALTLECGRPGDELGIHHAIELLDALLHLDHFPQRPLPPQDLQLVKTHATMYVPDDVSFDFNLSAQADVTFEKGFERRNFNEIKTTDIFAFTRIERPLSITDQQGKDVTDEFIRIENGKVYLNKPMMPAMITLDKTIVRQDCLCYLMSDHQVNA